MTCNKKNRNNAYGLYRTWPQHILLLKVDVKLCILMFGMLQESCEAAEDAVVDLVDYCHRKLTLLAGRCARGEIPTEDRTSQTEVSDMNTVQVKEQKLSYCKNILIFLNIKHSLIDHRWIILYLQKNLYCTLQQIGNMWLATPFWIFHTS